MRVVAERSSASIAIHDSAVTGSVGSEITLDHRDQNIGRG